MDRNDESADVSRESIRNGGQKGEAVQKRKELDGPDSGGRRDADEERRRGTERPDNAEERRKERKERANDERWERNGSSKDERSREQQGRMEDRSEGRSVRKEARDRGEGDDRARARDGDVRGSSKDDKKVTEPKNGRERERERGFERDDKKDRTSQS
ncbi:hypothetical protein KFL_000910235 [Klebsormidium nitens]|uniref:Uncharacterized protein n=1 Tax=Klebsormidium nitens TaxID=105231 RepID=A0A1Y1HT59_KLENI|nr:hypothetical protein KFL_000910235 [Klebsormidium nitens]|eukprot:GAQ81804.1 hypothetical protein KFL_000910235 [Klebsormidium nitens]